MRIPNIGRVLRRALIAAAALLIIAPGFSWASDEAPSGQPHDADSSDRESLRGARSYSSVLIGSLLVGFTEGFIEDPDRHGRRVRGADLERMERIYREAVASNLGPELVISEVPGPGVVRADALLVDHVLDKRDWLSPAVTMFRSAPEVQVVVFLRDSRSDELVDTVGLTLSRRSNRLMRAGPGDYWQYMRLVFDRVATRVRWALEDRVPES